jgi:hypothetical protein
MSTPIRFDRFMETRTLMRLSVVARIRLEILLSSILCPMFGLSQMVAAKEGSAIISNEKSDRLA